MISKISVLIALAILSAPLSAEPAPVNDNAQLQATDTADISQDDIAANCDHANSVCDEAFARRRINLDGWIWASTEKRRKRFASLSRHERNVTRT